MKLAVADIERDHARGAALQQHVGEAAGRCADVERVAPPDVEPELVEGVRELFAAARDEPRRPLEVEVGVLLDLRPRLVEALDEPGHHERLRLGAGLGEAALDEQHVEALLHADTHYPTVKAWLFLTDIDENNGAFVYSKGSHKLSFARVRHEYEISVNTARMRECLIDGADPSDLLQIIAEGDYYGMQTFDQSLLDLVARGEVMAAEATAMAINPHNFRLELTQLDGAIDGSTQVLNTGLRPKA